MYLKGWRAAVCTSKYEEMASLIFERNILGRIPIISGLLALWHRSLYNSEGLEKAIGDAYGAKRRMLDPSYASSIGSRIILPATTSPVPSMLLFTNYRGIGKGGDVMVSDV